MQSMMVMEIMRTYKPAKTVYRLRKCDTCGEQPPFRFTFMEVIADITAHDETNCTDKLMENAA